MGIWPRRNSNFSFMLSACNSCLLCEKHKNEHFAWEWCTFSSTRPIFASDVYASKNDFFERLFLKWAFGLDEITTFLWYFSIVTLLYFLQSIKISISLGSGAHFQTNARFLVRYYRPLQPVGSSKSSAQYYRPISFNESVSAPCVSHCKGSLSHTSTTDESSCNSCFHHNTSSSSLN